MLKHLIFIIIFFYTVTSISAAEHPSLFITKKEAAEIRDSIDKLPLLKKSFEDAKTHVDFALSQPILVPPPGEAGGYEHENGILIDMFSPSRKNFLESCS
jgi:hypothetical protein